MRASELHGGGGGFLVISWRVMKEGKSVLGFRDLRARKKERTKKQKKKKFNGPSNNVGPADRVSILCG